MQTSNVLERCHVYFVLIATFPQACRICLKSRSSEAIMTWSQSVFRQFMITKSTSQFCPVLQLGAADPIKPGDHFSTVMTALEAAMKMSMILPGQSPIVSFVTKMTQTTRLHPSRRMNLNPQTRMKRCQ